MGWGDGGVKMEKVYLNNNKKGIALERIFPHCMIIYHIHIINKNVIKFGGKILHQDYNSIVCGVSKQVRFVKLMNMTSLMPLLIFLQYTILAKPKSVLTCFQCTQAILNE